MEKQKCSKCGDELPLDEFHLRYQKAGVTKRHKVCKGCVRTYAKEYRKRHTRKKQEKRPTSEFTCGPFVCF